MVGEAPKRTEDTLDAYVARGLQVTAAERAEFLGSAVSVRAKALLRAPPKEAEDDDRNDRDWGAPKPKTLYDSDDSDASDEDDTTGLGIAELKARYGVNKGPREKRPASSNGSGPKKRKKALKAPIDRFARRRDPRLSIQDAERGGAANDAEKRRREDLALAGARRRAEAMAAAERAVEAFDAAAWLEGARCAVDAAARGRGPPGPREAGGLAAQHDGAPRGDDWAPPPLEARLDQETRTASAEAAAACETFGILNVDTLFAKLRRRRRRPWSPREPRRRRRRGRTSGRRCGRPAPRGAVLRRGPPAAAAARRQGRINCCCGAGPTSVRPRPRRSRRRRPRSRRAPPTRRSPTGCTPPWRWKTTPGAGPSTRRSRRRSRA